MLGSINRNIVECKVLIVCPDCIGIFFVLIETLWNVKIWKQAHDIGLSNRINRNIVECKVYLRSILPVTAIGINRNIVECKE